MQYSVPAINYSYLAEKVVQTNKKAVKLGVPLTTLAITREYNKECIIDTLLGTSELVLMYDIEVTSYTPVLNGYTFIAVISPLVTEEGPYNLVRAVPDAATEGELEAFRTVPMLCEHCHTIRNRKEVYVVRHTSGAIAQVGSSCLKDFTGHRNAETYAAWAESLTLLADLFRTAEDEDYSSGHDHTFSLEGYLHYVSAAIREYGFTSRRSSEETGKLRTAPIALSAMNDARLHIRTSVCVNEKDKQDTSNALAWIRAKAYEDVKDSDYLYNLWVSCKGYGITHRQCGIVASLFVAWHKATAQVIERETRVRVGENSVHVGNIGDKLAPFSVTCTFVKRLDGDWPSTLHKFLDEQGNVYTWFATREELEQGARYTLKGTVKAHSEYQGMKETMLTRCKTTILVPGEAETPVTV